MLNMEKKPFGRFVKVGVRYIKTGGTPEEAANAGYVYDPLTGLELEKVKKKAQIARKRWQVEYAGFTLPPEQGGMEVRTDDRTRTLMALALIEAKADPAYEVLNWKLSDGSFITLGSAMVQMLHGAMQQFIGAQFAKEASLSAQIDSATTTEEISAIAW